MEWQRDTHRGQGETTTTITRQDMLTGGFTYASSTAAFTRAAVPPADAYK
jgi:hypothetical protein